MLAEIGELLVYICADVTAIHNPDVDLPTCIDLLQVRRFEFLRHGTLLGFSAPVSGLLAHSAPLAT